VFKWKPIASRSQGRPKNRWEDNALNDRKQLGINNWRRCIHDRIKWKVIVEKAKTLTDEVVAPEEEEEK
jgi:hypothetical protein